MAHRASLEGGYSGSVKLQRFVNEHGIGTLDIEIIPYSENRAALFEIERNIIIEHNSVNNGLNCSVETVVPIIPFTEERRRKIGEKSKGRVHSELSRKRMSDSLQGVFVGEKHHMSKLTNDEVRTIKGLLDFFGTVEISRLFNVNFRTIDNIKTGRRWGRFEKRSLPDEEISAYRELFEKMKKPRSNSVITEHEVSYLKELLRGSHFTKEKNRIVIEFFDMKHSNLSGIKHENNWGTVEPKLIPELDEKFRSFVRGKDLDPDVLFPLPV